MRGTIAVGVAVALLTTVPAMRAQEAEAKPTEAAKPPGKRLLVQFVETRQKGETVTATRTYSMALQADADAASVFIGHQLTMTLATQTPTTVFKNAGVQAQVKVETLPDGRYRLDASFDDTSAMGDGGLPDARVTAGNTVLRAVRAHSEQLTVREGEAVALGDAVDIVTGELVRVGLTVSEARASGAASSPGLADARLRVQLVLVRRQGQARVARRPYSVTLDAGEKAAEVFSGNMLPVQTVVQSGPTIALKDIGAGLQVLSAKRIADGRYRLGVRFSDGVLVEGTNGPRIRGFESESQLFLREGETVTVASAVDPETGEVVEAELTLEGAR